MDVERIVMAYFKALSQPSSIDGRKNAIQHPYLEYSILEVKDRI